MAIRVVELKLDFCLRINIPKGNSDFCKLLRLPVSPILKIQKFPLGMLGKNISNFATIAKSPAREKDNLFPLLSHV